MHLEKKRVLYDTRRTYLDAQSNLLYYLSWKEDSSIFCEDLKGNKRQLLYSKKNDRHHIMGFGIIDERYMYISEHFYDRDRNNTAYIRCFEIQKGFSDYIHLSEQFVKEVKGIYLFFSCLKSSLVASCSIGYDKRKLFLRIFNNKIEEIDDGTKEKGFITYQKELYNVENGSLVNCTTNQVLFHGIDGLGVEFFAGNADSSCYLVCGSFDLLNRAPQNSFEAEWMKRLRQGFQIPFLVKKETGETVFLDIPLTFYNCATFLDDELLAVVATPPHGGESWILIYDYQEHAVVKKMWLVEPNRMFTACEILLFSHEHEILILGDDVTYVLGYRKLVYKLLKSIPLGPSDEPPRSEKWPRTAWGQS